MTRSGDLTALQNHIKRYNVESCIILVTKMFCFRRVRLAKYSTVIFISNNDFVIQYDFPTKLTGLKIKVNSDWVQFVEHKPGKVSAIVNNDKTGKSFNVKTHMLHKLNVIRSIANVLTKKVLEYEFESD